MSCLGDSGTCSEGLHTKVFPHATANGKNHIGTMAGKLNGAMAQKTPSGWRTDSQSMPRAMSSRACPINKEGAPIATSTIWMPRRTLPRDSGSVLPFSRVTATARSSAWSSSRFRRRNRNWMRSSTGRSRQSPNAACAPRTAASTSATPPSGTSPINSPVAGLRTSWTFGASEATQPPST